MDGNKFLTIWRNSYLKNLILNQISLYNLHYSQRSFNIEEIDAFEFKEYLNSVLIFNINEKIVPTLSNYLPNNIKHLEFGDEDFDCLIETTSFTRCKNLKSIKFNDRFNQEIIAGSIPATVEIIEFGFHYNQPLKEGSLPPNLKSLKMGYHYNQPFNFALPKSLEYLNMGFKNENSINDINVSSNIDSLGNLKILILGNRFNQNLELNQKHSSSIKHLELGCKFNKSITGNSLPLQLETLKISNNFNQSLENLQLLKNLKTLYIGKEFNQKLFNDNQDFKLPDTIEFLEFGQDWSVPKDAPKENNITTIKYCGELNQKINKNQLPKNLKILKLNGHYCENSGNNLLSPSSLPSSLKKLTLIDLISPSLIPSSVEKLTIENGYNKAIDSSLLPKSITHLKFNNSFNQTLQPGCFDSIDSLKILQFRNSFDNGGVQLSPNIFPSKTLKYLEIGDFFTQHLGTSLSNTSIEHLILGKNFNSTIEPGQLPKTLKSLSINNNSEFQFQFELNSFPNSIQLLSLGFGINQELNERWLPKNLKHLIIFGNPSISSLPNSLSSLITHGNNKEFINNFYTFEKIELFLTLLKIYNLNYLSNNFKYFLNKLN